MLNEENIVVDYPLGAPSAEHCGTSVCRRSIKINLGAS